MNARHAWLFCIIVVTVGLGSVVIKDKTMLATVVYIIAGISGFSYALVAFGLRSWRLKHK